MRSMDPHLWELLEEGGPDDEVSAALRLHHPDRVPSGVRIVARFGEIVTCRLRRRDIPAVRADGRVASLKAPDPMIPEHAMPALESLEGEAAMPLEADERRPRELMAAGRGVVVGVVDWGADPVHPNFRHADGRTRLLALWDQRGRPGRASVNPYGYGVIHSADAINRGLESEDPYAALGYDPRDSDPDGFGSHGSHVMDIAAGSGRTGPAGLAPEAELIFVHLASTGTTGLATLGDSVALLEAVDFIARSAGERPWVANLSIGNHGGPHDGSTLVELGFDRALLAAPGRAIVQSCGNYFERHTHTFGALRPGETKVLTWETDAADRTDNELELWYSGRDRFIVEVEAPNGLRSRRVALGENATLTVDGQPIGRVYHRAADPNNGDHHINMFLYPGAPAGEWRVILGGEDVVDGRFHGWIERDEGCHACQSRFAGVDAAPVCTTGTICNGLRTIAVGAYDSRSPHRAAAPFSSMGPTRDGRQKPDVGAPGVGILAARSASGDEAAMLTRKSGTSMAAPHVTGCIALMFEVAPRRLHIEETRRILLSTALPVEGDSSVRARFGSGHLGLAAAVEAARRVESAAVRRPEAIESVSLDEAGHEAPPSMPATEPIRLDEVAEPEGDAQAPVVPAFDSADVIAGPGDVLRVALSPGDVVVEVPRRQPPRVSVLSAGVVLTLADVRRRGLAASGPGRYVVVQDGPPRHIADEAGRLAPDVTILRPRRAGRDAFAEGRVDPTTRLRLSVWAPESIVPSQPSGRTTAAGHATTWPMDLRDPAAQAILRERLRQAQGQLDDLTLTRTIFLDGTRPGGAVAWDRSFLRGVTNDTERQAQLGALVHVCHLEGIQVLAGYGEVTEGRSHTPAGDAFVSLLTQGDAAIERHGQEIVRFLFEASATRVPFDGISLDLEINGLGAQHKPAMRHFMKKLTEALRREGRFLAFAAPPMVSPTSTTLRGGPLSGWMQSQALDVAQGIPGLVARPMVYDGPTPDVAYHTAIIEFALRPASDPRGGGGLTEAQLQVGVKITKNQVIRNARGAVVRGEWDGVMREPDAIAQRAAEVMRPNGIGLAFWHLKSPVAAHMQEIARIGAGLNPRPSAPPAGVSFQPIQAPRRPRIAREL
jgi:Subtilase family